MPTKTSVGPNEVVRLEVLRLAPPLEVVRLEVLRLPPPFSGSALKF